MIDPYRPDPSPKCLHHRWAEVHDAETAPCQDERVFDTPYCLHHLHDVAWLSLGRRPERVRVERVPVVVRESDVPALLSVVLAVVMWWLACSVVG